jgi:hypothetical protein
MRKTCLAVAAVLLFSSLVQPVWAGTPEGPAAPAANSPPTAVISEPRNGAIILVGSPTQFVGSNSTDPDGDRLHFKWHFGDGDIADWDIKPNATHTYLSPGLRVVNLTVNDTQAEDRATIVVQVVPVPDPNSVNVRPKAAIDGNKTAYT